MLPLMIMITTTLPELGGLMGVAGDIKSRKHQNSHPLKEFLAESKAEWDMYIKYFKEHNMVDDRPYPEYPYTEEIVNEFMEEALQIQGVQSAEANSPIRAFINN